MSLKIATHTVKTAPTLVGARLSPPAMSNLSLLHFVGHFQSPVQAIMSVLPLQSWGIDYRREVNGGHVH